ncbi:hypothetical protein OSTOST_21499 [Ostertagia ostertagi]
MSATKWKVFFDISCPNSWISFKLLNSGKLPLHIDCLDFVPISDVKLHLIRTYEARMRRRWKRNDEELTITSIPGNTELFSKTVQDTECKMIPDNWEAVRSTILLDGTLLPAIFLSSVKKRYPEHFLHCVEIIGERIWDLQQPVRKGAHLFQCSRAAGVSFRDSEELVSRLPHMDSRQLLHENSLEALQLGASSAPFFASTNGIPTTTFNNFNDFKRFVLTS